MKFLLVDDDPVALDLLSNILIGCGYEDLVCAQSGNEALQHLKLRQTPFDCLMLDLRIPDIDGITLCRMVRQFKEYEKTPIMMITVAREEELIASAFSAGATDYIFKPFDVVELMKRVRIAEIIEDPVQARELALARSGQRNQEQFNETMLTRLKVDRYAEDGTQPSTLSRMFKQLARYSTLFPKALRYVFMNGSISQITKLLTSAKPDHKGADSQISQ